MFYLFPLEGGDILNLFGKKIYSKVKVTKQNVFLEDNDKNGRITIPKTFDGTVLLNGKPIIGLLEFNINDKISININNPILKEASYSLDIEIAPDNMSANLTKTVLKGTGKVLEEKMEDNPSLKIIQIDIFPEPIPIDDLEEFVSLKGITHGINDVALSLICISEENIKETISIGKKPKSGKPTGFHLLNGIINNEKIDKDIFFAEFKDAEGGENGYTIFGNPIIPEIKTIFPDFGNNVLVDDRGLMSLEKGRLIFNDFKVEIIKEEEIVKTYNWEDGTIVLDGDLIITGDIKEGGQIKCTGNLLIKGSVVESYVFAEGDIIIEGNVEQSVLYSGFETIAFQNLETFSLQYLQILERVMFESSFFANDGTDYTEKTNSINMAKSEFEQIHNSSAPFITLVQDFGGIETQQIYTDFEKVKNESRITILNDQSSQDDIKVEMEKFYQLIKESKEKVIENKGDIVINSSNSSHLFASNNVNINGSGIFQTNIEARNGIVITGKSISSNLIANNFVDVNEFEAIDEISNKILVKKNSGFIKLNTRITDTWIYLGEKGNINDSLQRNVSFTKENFPKEKNTK